MPVVGSIKAPAAAHWPVPRRNHNGFALRQTNHASDRLRPRLLFHQEQFFATGKFDFGLTQTADDLKRRLFRTDLVKRPRPIRGRAARLRPECGGSDVAASNAGGSPAVATEAVARRRRTSQFRADFPVVMSPELLRSPDQTNVRVADDPPGAVQTLSDWRTEGPPTFTQPNVAGTPGIFPASRTP